MSLLVLGINHKSTSIKLRERLAFDSALLPEALESLRALENVREAAILSTCNRSELYCICNDQDASSILTWLSEYHQVPLLQFSDQAYEKWQGAAVRHMMEVASGLDSMILGEPQIFGQMKSAFTNAQHAGSLGPELSRLFQHIFASAKEIRTETELGAHPVSLAYISLTLAKRIFSDISKNRVLLIGAGEMIELVAKHFYENGIEQIIVANRTLEKADVIAQQVNGHSITLSEIPEQLHKADIVITSTASPVPVLGKGTVESALKKRMHKPMFMVDLAVPRDIEGEVEQLDDVYLFTIDDLQEIIHDNLKNRETAREQAQFIIDRRSAEYSLLKKERMAVGTLKAYRSKIESLKEQELQKALKLLEAGEAPEVILERLSHNLVNKIMHEPSIALKKAGAEEKFEFLNWCKELFGLSANEISDIRSGKDVLKTDSSLPKADSSSSKADGSSSHAAGLSSHAAGLSSHADGSSSHADGSSSHADGSLSKADKKKPSS
jgi:glutamyl-tRNA reductase